MSVKKVSTSSIKTNNRSIKFWDQDTAQGSLIPITTFVSSSIANILISNIPQIYTDLMVVIYHNTQQVGSVDDYMYFGQNGLGGTNYSVTRMTSNGSSATSDRTTNSDGIYAAIRPAFSYDLFGSSIYHVFNYASTNTFKTVLVRNAADKNGSGVTQLSVGTMRSNLPITDILIGGTGNYPGIGTTVSVYGIRAGS